MSRRDVGVFAAGCVLTFALTTFGHFNCPGAAGATAYQTTNGRSKVRGEKAFVLAVTLQFRDEASATPLLKAWAAAADYCVEHEPFLYAYEMARSDQDPMRYTIIERYRSKDDYTGAHRHSPAFKAFRPQMKALQDSGAVVVSGGSYIETGLGFT